jgi:hypothetical protein
MSNGATQKKALALIWGIFAILGTQYLFPDSRFASPEQRKESCALLTSPQTVELGDTLRILAASEIREEGASISITGPSGDLRTTGKRSGGGPPFWWSAEAKIPQEGVYVISLNRERKSLVQRELRVPAQTSAATARRIIWEIGGEWNRATENLYSAWIDSLFHEADESTSWKALHEVTQDAQKNILHNHLMLGEDDPGEKAAIVMEPDCADAPYFLRAYFAWKMRLPFGFHECTRGSLEKAPACQKWISNFIERAQKNEAQAFNHFLRLILDAIHSGTARTLLEDENSDYYPVPLDRESLRPGVVFADPYGHTLVLVRWQPQTAEQPGQLFAVDAQPDGTIGLRRFWRGNFLFNTKNIIGNPGFKAFRPIMEAKGRLRPMTNDEIRKSADYGNFSLQQKNMEARDFYNILERLINPEPLDPVIAFHDLFMAFHEQLITRVLSVANAEEYKKAHPGAIIPMPNRPTTVFQDVGLWEDYSTPNRDIRLLIAMDTLSEFLEKVIRSPESFKFPKHKTAEQVVKELENVQQKWAREMTVTYTRTDGTPQTLTVEEILHRKEAFEMAYNPNDCIEIRWGAPEGSEELFTCRRRASSSQQERMKSLRHWFRDRLRPPT